MRAMILRHHADPSIAMLPVAGRPLLARQLEWLRGQGVEHIVLEVGVTTTDQDVLAWLATEPALSADVVAVSGRAPLTPHALAERAGWDGATGVIVPGDVLACADVPTLLASANHTIMVVHLTTPDGLLQGGLGVFGVDRSGVSLIAHGWSCRLRHRADALLVSSHILAGRLAGVEVPARKAMEGVWLARGARIEAGARVLGPVLVGPGALIRAGACVGPNVLVGAGAVIERDAVVQGAIVEPEVLVGEGFVANGVQVEPASLRNLRTGELVRLVDDPLELGHRDFNGGRARRASAVFAVLAPLVALAATTGWW